MGFDTKLEQAIYINKHGCNPNLCFSLGESRCQFAMDFCYVNPPNPEAQKKAIKYIRKEKLKKLNL